MKNTFIENPSFSIVNICRDGLDLHHYLYHGAEASDFQTGP